MKAVVKQVNPPDGDIRRGLGGMSTVTVMVHLDVDPWDAAQTAATRVSRRGRPDQWLRGDDRVCGCWDGPDAAGAAAAIARRLGLDLHGEQSRVRQIHTAFSDERGDPRWIVEFHIAR